MRKGTFVLFVLVILTFSACEKPMAPDLKNIENINISLNGFTSADFNCDANFYNPNDKKITLKHVNIDVNVDGNFLTNIERDYEMELAPLSEFTVPVEANIPFKNIDLNEALALFKSTRQSKLLHFKGKIKVKMYGMNFSIPVDHQENIHLN